MKTKPNLRPNKPFTLSFVLRPSVRLLAFCLLPFAFCLSALAQTTAWTYQGRLAEGTSAANGTYDLLFTLCDSANLPGSTVAGPVTNQAVAVSNGLFTVTLDFGTNVFSGDSRWLEIAVRTNGAPDYDTLVPRQALTPTPYAITAGNALLANIALGVPPDSIKGSSILDGHVVRSINGQTDHVLLPTNSWSLSGNSGTSTSTNFLGTTDDQPLDLRVKYKRALRLLPSTAAGSPPPILIGGDASNDVDPIAAGAVIGGGRMNRIEGGAVLTTLGGGSDNTVSSNASWATLAGGRGNLIWELASYSTISGGVNNRVLYDAQGASIGGGRTNLIHAFAVSATIGGGENNTVQSAARSAGIGGGDNNLIRNDCFAATIGGGSYNIIGERAHYGVIGGGEENIVREEAYLCTIGGGFKNQINPFAGMNVIGGGSGNRIGELAIGAMVGGGSENGISANSSYVVISGGHGNTIQTNAISATIPGGEWNVATNYAFAAGRRAQAVHAGAFVWADSQNADFPSMSDDQFSVRANGGARIVGGGGFANPQLQLTQTANDFARFRLANPSNSWDMAAGPDGSLRFYTAGADRMAVSSAGNVTATTFTPTSDRNAKENFSAVSAQEVLAKVAALPISRWNYKADVSSQHLGPMAQDFHAAFGLGPDDKHIATVDADGVALAAIQGLNEKVEGRMQNAEVRSRRLEEKLERKETEITELKARLDRLEQLLNRNAR